MNREEGLECEVYVDGIHLEHVLEFKYLGCVLNNSSIDRAECSRKVMIGSRVAFAIRSLVNARHLHAFVRVLHETLLVHIRTYGSETMYRWIILACIVLGGWIESQMHR